MSGGRGRGEATPSLFVGDVAPLQMAHQRALRRPSGHEVLLAVVLAGTKTAPPPHPLVAPRHHHGRGRVLRASRPRFRCAPHRPTHAHAGRRRVRCRGGVGGGRRRRRRACLVRWRTSWDGRAGTDGFCRLPLPPVWCPSGRAQLFSRLFFSSCTSFSLSLLAWNFICFSFLCLGLFLLQLWWHACSGAYRCPRRAAAAAARRSPPLAASPVFLLLPPPYSHSLLWPPPVPRAPWIWPPASSSASKPSVRSPPPKPRRRAAVPPRRPPPPLPPPRPRRWRKRGRLRPPPARHRPRRAAGASFPAAAGAPMPAVAPPPRAAPHPRAAGAPRRPPAGIVLVERPARRSRRRRGRQCPRSLLHPAPRPILERRGPRVGPPPIVERRRRWQPPPPPPAACAQRPFPAAVVAPAGDSPLQAGAQ